MRFIIVMSPDGTERGMFPSTNVMGNGQPQLDWELSRGNRVVHEFEVDRTSIHMSDHPGLDSRTWYVASLAEEMFWEGFNRAREDAQLRQILEPRGAT